MNSKVYKWCAVSLCKNTSIKTPNKLFVYVSNKKVMRDKWLILAGRDPATLRTTSSLYFCEDHFDLPNDMENYMQYHLMGHVSQVRMKPGCIPTKFSCLEDGRKPRKLVHKKRNMKAKENCVKQLKECDMNTVTVEIKIEEIDSSRSVEHNQQEDQQVTTKRRKKNKAHMTKTLRSKVNRRKARLVNQWTSLSNPVSTSPLKKNRRGKSTLSKSNSKEQDAPNPPDVSSEESQLTDADNLDSSIRLEDPLATEPSHRTPQCRLCAEFSEDCVDVTDEDRPYLTRNITTITLNHLSVELDFNDALPKTVCRVCDEKLQGMFDFLKQVKEAQDSLSNVTDMNEDVYVLVVKTECESPTPDDDMDSKVDVDSLPVTKNIVKTIKRKRKSVESAPRTHKKPKVTEDEDSLNVDLIVDIKEEPSDMVDAYEAGDSEFNDTEIDFKPSELELENLLKLMNKPQKLIRQTCGSGTLGLT